ncbi:MAG TPA: glycosylase, partial [Pseudothermotoga sp.]|nr:glycosylase [Pseudothermotoga sp.]
MKIYCEELSFMPWEERPSGFEGVLWRYSKNPITKRNPIRKGARVFNSAVLRYGGKFEGIVR